MQTHAHFSSPAGPLPLRSPSLTPDHLHTITPEIITRVNNHYLHNLLAKKAGMTHAVYCAFGTAISHDDTQQAASSLKHPTKKGLADQPLARLFILNLRSKKHLNLMILYPCSQ